MRDQRLGTSTGTRFYEIRCHVEPYDGLTPLVVQACGWDEVLKKYPDAEFMTVLGEKDRPEGRQAAACMTVPQQPTSTRPASIRPRGFKRRTPSIQPQRRKSRRVQPLQESITALALVTIVGLLLWVLGTTSR
jgi:hypothetical protein